MLHVAVDLIRHTSVHKHLPTVGDTNFLLLPVGDVSVIVVFLQNIIVFNFVTEEVYCIELASNEYSNIVAYGLHCAY